MKDEWTGSHRFIQSELDRVGPVGFPRLEQLVAVIVPTQGGSTRVTFKLLVFDLAVQGQTLTLVPQRRDYAYRRATELLGELEGVLSES